MKFWLTKVYVRKLTLEHSSDASDADGLLFGSSFDVNQKRGFAVAFDLRAKLHSHGFLRLEYLALFNTEGDITEEFKKSHLARANAPAIAYPYLRAFVSQFCTLSGFEPLTLPIRGFSPDTRPPPPPARLPSTE